MKKGALDVPFLLLGLDEINDLPALTLGMVQ